MYLLNLPELEIGRVMDRSKWEYKKLGDICKSINAGGTPSRGNSAYWNGNIPWVKIRDMNSKYVNSTEEFITEEGLNNSSAKLFEPGTILYSIFATIGAASILEIPATTNQAIAGIVLGDGCDRDFYYYYLTSLKTHFENISKGVAQNNINLSVLRNQKVVVPPISDQQRIVAELDCLNEMIAVKQEQLKEFDKLAQSIFYDMFGDPVANEKGWEKKTIGEVASFYNGKAHENDIDKNGEFILVNAKFIASEGLVLKRTNKQLFPLYEKDIVMVMSDVPNGKALARCYLIKHNNIYSLNQRICAFRDYSQNPIFLLFLLNRNKYYLRFDDGNGQTNLRKNDVLGCPIILPPLSLQQQFAGMISAIEAQKELVKQSIAETQALLDYTLDKYFG